MTKQKKKAPILPTETETDHVAGGLANNGNDGNHFGQKAQELDVHPWQVPRFKGDAHQ